MRGEPFSSSCFGAPKTEKLSAVHPGGAVHFGPVSWLLFYFWTRELIGSRFSSVMVLRTFKYVLAPTNVGTR